MVLRASAIFSMLSWFVVMAPLSSYAQQINGCTQSQLTDPPRVVYQCGNGLVLEAEAAAALDIQDTSGQAGPQTVDLAADGVFIEVEPGNGPFQIRTPQAIAAVRGTEFVVDVQDQMTSVFVTRGEVQVTRTNGQDAVSLTPGEGVEVTDAAPLEVKRWPLDKVARLLARFGR